MRRFLLMPILAMTLATVLSGCIIEPEHGYHHGYHHDSYYSGGWGHHHERW